MDDLRAKEYLELQKEIFRKTMALEMNLAVNAAISALKKQIPEKPINDNDDTAHCPECGHSYPPEYYYSELYCSVCGQALDWGK